MKIAAAIHHLNTPLSLSASSAQQEDRAQSTSKQPIISTNQSTNQIANKMGDRATSFPILKNSVILQIMEEVEIPLTESELIEPGRCKERIREVFARLLMLCWGMTDESALSALPSRLTNNKNNSKLLPHYYSQLYAEALPEIKFFSQLSKLMTICGNPDFGFKDLQAPTAKRLKRQLSAVINFLKFKEDMQCLVEQGQEEVSVVVV